MRATAHTVEADQHPAWLREWRQSREDENWQRSDELTELLINTPAVTMEGLRAQILFLRHQAEVGSMSETDLERRALLAVCRSVRTIDVDDDLSMPPAADAGDTDPSIALYHEWQETCDREREAHNRARAKGRRLTDDESDNLGTAENEAKRKLWHARATTVEGATGQLKAFLDGPDPFEGIWGNGDDIEGLRSVLAVLEALPSSAHPIDKRAAIAASRASLRSV